MISSISSSNYFAEVAVTAANPAPGQPYVAQYPVRSGTGYTYADVTQSDGGIGLNTYVAGGTQPDGAVYAALSATSIQPTGEEPAPIMRLVPSRANPNGTFQVVEMVRLVGGNHDGITMDTIRWTSGTAFDGGVLYQGTGFAQVVPGTSSNGSAFLMTTTNARYITPFPNVGIFVIRTSDEGVAGNVRRWGVTDGEVNNYLGFELSGTDRSIVIQGSGSTLVRIPQPTGTSHPSSDRAHRYEIHWMRERAVFYIDDIIVLDYQPTGTLNTILTAMTLRARARATNGPTPVASGTGYLEVHEASISRFGTFRAQPYWAYFPSGSNSMLLKKGPGTLYRVTVNDAGAAQGAYINLYDSLSGSGPLIAQINAAKIPNPITLEYELEVSNGLYAVSLSGSPNFTVIFD